MKDENLKRRKIDSFLKFIRRKKMNEDEIKKESNEIISKANKRR